MLNVERSSANFNLCIKNVSGTCKTQNAHKLLLQRIMLVGAFQRVPNVDECFASDFDVLTVSLTEFCTQF